MTLSSASPSLLVFQKAASRGEKEEYFDQNWQTQGQEEEKREKPEKTEYAIQKRLWDKKKSRAYPGSIIEEEKKKRKIWTRKKKRRNKKKKRQGKEQGKKRD